MVAIEISSDSQKILREAGWGDKELRELSLNFFINFMYLESNLLRKESLRAIKGNMNICEVKWHAVASSSSGFAEKFPALLNPMTMKIGFNNGKLDLIKIFVE